ncbi:VOC family protein [Microtetraspora sp. NBRC 16547]|uniref:VOC family protein n=1 Tax=Microtetraspora sp. NBRC 16547 TaxID=3030993 RepID=UPI0024A2480A|nr:VOC family protein [Microtetraspora sp. NBRC 16547]GLW99330.1 glyoxalase [Microtetraspora sp. NBRC 16547]
MSETHPPSLIGVNHVAYQTLDLPATHDFYTRVLKCRFAGAIRSDGITSTSGETSPPFLHVFYATDRGDCLAFFALEGEYEKKDDGLPAFTRHIALGVRSTAELEQWRDRLSAEGIEVSPTIDHDGIWESIYVWDPNGVRVELTHQVRDLGEQDAAEAEHALQRWLEEHAADAV